MGIDLETWRCRVGLWSHKAVKLKQGRGYGLGNLAKLVLFLLVFLLKLRVGTFISKTRVFCQHIFRPLQLLLLASSMSAVIAMVAYNLMFDVETNPGPTPHACSNTSQCPGAGRLGPQKGALHLSTTADPLERLLAGSTYTLGGAARYISSLKTAIDSFIKRVHPGAGGKGLVIVPSIPSPEGDFTWRDVTLHSISERHGGLLEGDTSLQYANMDPAKKRVIDDLIKKYTGDEGEWKVLLPLIESVSNYGGTEATVIVGQKSTLELVEDSMEKLLAQDNFQEPVDRQLEIFQKVAETVGINLDHSAIDLSVEDTILQYLGQAGAQPVAVMKARITAHENNIPHGLTRRQKEERQKKLKEIKSILAKTNMIIFDTRKELKLMEVKKIINTYKKEHDLVLLKPDYRHIVQFEVKAMVSKQNHEITKALQQLSGGVEEYARIHGHVIDSDWTFVGVVVLPNLPLHMKNEIIRDHKICNNCSNYILVGDINGEVNSLLITSFPNGSEYQDTGVWQAQYKELVYRMLAMDHLIQPLPAVKRITGRTDQILSAFTEGDEMPDLDTCSAQEVKDWKTEKHIGSPTSVIFLTGNQRQLWRKRIVLFLADYSTGKTTMLKSKAVSLARMGKQVTYIFLGGDNGETEPVMFLATRRQMAKYANIVVLSLQDLRRYFRSNAMLGVYRPCPTPLALLYFYMKGEKPEHTFVDEVPFEPHWQLARWTLMAFLRSIQSPIIVYLVYLILFSIVGFASAMTLLIFSSFYTYWSLLLFLPPLLHTVLLYYVDQKSSTLDHTIRVLFNLSSLCFIAMIIQATLYTTWSLLPALGLLWLLPASGWLNYPVNLYRSSDLLISLPPLLNSSSTLWIAMSSSYFTDSMLSARNIPGLAKWKEWQKELTKLYCCPSLSNNLRNTKQVANSSSSGGLWGLSKLPPTSALSPPPPAPSINPTNDKKSLLLPISCMSKLQAAVKHSYKALGSPDTLVVLLGEAKYFTPVKTALTQEGIHVVTYREPNEEINCNIFLTNPKGALVTTGSLFSGMEAVSVIVVKGDFEEMGRSNALRAIEGLVTVLPDIRDNRENGDSKIDGRFAHCYLPWAAQVYRCEDQCCPDKPIMCPPCYKVCHAFCTNGTDNFKPEILKTAMQLFGRHTSCSCRGCKTTGCQLRH